VWLRLPALLAGVASIAVLYAIVRSLVDTRAALLAASMLAVAPYAVSRAEFGRAFALADLNAIPRDLLRSERVLPSRSRW
jgi:uncharacterized membrane protein